jgi:hypothetical protein
MTRFRFLPLAATMVLALSLNLACSGKHSTTIQNDEGEPNVTNSVVSVVKMNDASSKGQLARGFYAIEGNAWRWTSGSFSVVLKTPPGAAQKGATLTMALTVSDVILKQVHFQTLTASVGTTKLNTEKYVDAGTHTFTATIPASLLTGDTVTVDFSLDNTLPPGVDRRELGVIVSSVGIESN